MKLALAPAVETVEKESGIGRVLHAQVEWLPRMGIEFADPRKADVIAAHVWKMELPRVDALHVHGLYWTGDDQTNKGQYGAWHSEVNRKIVESARQARLVTVPSRWVAEPFKRDMRFSPTIIGHGVELDVFTPIAASGRKDYVLWNKNRNADVCDPMPAWDLAQRGAPVVTTYAPEGKPAPETLQVIGKLPHAQMRDCVQHAQIYLATTQETFGIGTLEAMACGIPVLGYNWGGTADIVQNGIDGMLVEPGDLDALWVAYEHIKANWAEFALAARVRAEQFSWQKVMRQYAGAYASIAAPLPPLRVGVVITAYNYAQYVAEAIESVLRQTRVPDDVVVVDDGSTDGTPDVLARYAGRVRVIRQENRGVAAARNRGVAECKADLVVCLDADDRLGARYAEECLRAFGADRGLGLAWTGLSAIQNDGGISGNIWEGDFSWAWQAEAGLPPHTTIPTAAMFRKSLWARCGGYRQEFAPGEDAEFYTRLLACGATAKRATTDALIEYRNHGQGAHKTRPYVAINADKPWMMDRQFPFAAPSAVQPVVRSYVKPLVSVIVPVSRAHLPFLRRALWSVEGQYCRAWELVIANDTGAPLPATLLRPFPYARVVDTPGGKGAGRARNRGVDAASAPLVLFLDADDQLSPAALSAMLRRYAEGEGRYVYSDWGRWAKDGKFVHEPTDEYNPLEAMRDGLHAVTVLMARAVAQRVRFDETLEAFEDYDFFARCAAQGVWGERIPQPLVICDVEHGTRTQAARARRESITAEIRRRYEQFLQGEMMPTGCCGGNGAAVLEAKARIGAWGNEMAAGVQGASDPSAAAAVAADGNVRMRYTGIRVGAVTYFGGNKRQYRAGNNTIERFVNANADDVQKLLATGEFEIVRQPPSPQEMMRAAEPPSPLITHLTLTPEEIAVEQVAATRAEVVMQEPPVPAGTNDTGAGAEALTAARKPRRARKVLAVSQETSNERLSP